VKLYLIKLCEVVPSEDGFWFRVASTRCKIMAVASEKRLREAIEKVMPRDIAYNILEKLREQESACVEAWCVEQIEVFM